MISLVCRLLPLEPRHEKTCFMPFANKKGTDQPARMPAHPCSLISAFVVRCIDSIVAILSKFKFSRLQLVSVVAQAGLSLTWSQTRTGFLMTWLISDGPWRSAQASTNLFLHTDRLLNLALSPAYREDHSRDSRPLIAKVVV